MSNRLAPTKIAVVGGSGAGKTTLGKELARWLDAPFIEVDAIRHKANWECASPAEVRTAVHAVLGDAPRWVIDGFCGKELGDYVPNLADTIVWLDFRLGVKLARLLRRSFQRVTTQEPLWNGNTETWRGVFVGGDSVIGHPLRTHFRQRRHFAQTLEAQKTVRLHDLNEVKVWLAQLRVESPPTGR